MFVNPTYVSEPCVKNRKYDNNYIRFGFSYIGDKDCPRPQCVVCGDILANSSLKPSLLKRHLETKHPTHVNKSADFFTRKANEWKNDLTTFVSAANSDIENALEASYRVSYRIAKTAKPHSIAEDLVRPCINDVVQCMLGKSFTKKSVWYHCPTIRLTAGLKTWQIMSKMKFWKEFVPVLLLRFNLTNRLMLPI